MTLRVDPQSGGRTSLDDRFDATLRAARAGAEQAWTLLYQDLAGPLLGYLTAQGARDPEDLVGEVFLQVVRDLDRFEGDEAGFRSWVFTIAHRRLIDARRAVGRRPSQPASDAELEAVLPPSTTEPDALERLSTEQVHRLLEQLTDDQREVLVLRLVAGLRAGEIAEITGRPPDAVKALQKRGIRRLRTVLERSAAAPPGQQQGKNGSQNPSPPGGRQR